MSKEEIIDSLYDILDEIDETPGDEFVDIVYIKETLENIIKMSKDNRVRPVEEYGFTSKKKETVYEICKRIIDKDPGGHMETLEELFLSVSDYLNQNKDE